MPGSTNQTLRPFLWRAERLHPEVEVVSRTHYGIERYDYATYADRVTQLANAITASGIGDGDRVATFCWNHHRHFETYFGVPNIGAQLHTINPLLPDHHIEYIVEDAADKLFFVDPSLIGKLEGPATANAFDAVEQFVVMGTDVPETSLEPVTDHESFISDRSTDIEWPSVSEDQPAGMCYTSGTTGQPKGVEYTQQMLWAHTMGTLPDMGIGISQSDVVMPVVPMFHVNAWGLPFTTTAAGAKHVYPGPSPDPADLAFLIEEENVTISAGVPNVWMGLLEYGEGQAIDLTSLERIVIGGAAAPESVIQEYDETYNVDILHAWGMTEMSPIGTVSHTKSHMEDWDRDDIYGKRGKQGLIVPGLEMKVVDDQGEEIPWNGDDFGELLVRGPWVTTEYFKRPAANEEDFKDGWLKTGDVVTVDEEGYINIVDREKDVIKSGGEWISSVELENSIMAHPDVSEATVIGIPHEKWQERPVAFIVPGGDMSENAIESEVLDMLREDYPKWWLPDEILFIDEVPKTATGKFSKKTLREEYDDSSIVEGKAPERE